MTAEITEIKKPETLEEVERYLNEKEMTWQKRRQECYDEFVALIVKARGLTQDILDVIEEFRQLQCKMANTDTIRFIGNGFRQEAVEREYGDPTGTGGESAS